MVKFVDVMRRVNRVLWFAFALGAFVYGQAPTPRFADPGAPPFIFRVQRGHSGKDLCAIVRGDGLFHLEQETSNHVEIAEGTLDGAELAALKTVLDDRELMALNQDKIPVPLMITDSDNLRISILRSPLTQNILFIDRESRRPFDGSVEPVLRWIDLLQKHSHTSLDEFSGRNHCLPPHKIELSSRPTEKKKGESVSSNLPGAESPVRGSTPPTSPKAVFLMRWQFNHIAEGAASDTCIVIYPSGLFRMEKSNQRYDEKLKVRTFQDSLSEIDTQELKRLLDEPELKASTHQNFPTGKVFREGELTTLAIFRDSNVQQLSFASYFGVPGYISNLSAGTDPEERMVKPLRKWLKDHIEARKLKPLPDAAPTHCLAVTEDRAH